jgi:hypothetical protein
MKVGSPFVGMPSQGPLEILSRNAEGKPHNHRNLVGMVPYTKILNQFAEPRDRLTWTLRLVANRVSVRPFLSSASEMR